jgi:hypothetical protein
VSGWTINVPYRSLTEPLTVAAAHARGAPEVRELMLSAVTELGCSSVGDLLDTLGRMPVAERRALLDAARVSAGLPTTSEVEREAGISRMAKGTRVPAEVEMGLRQRPDGAWEETPPEQNFTVGGSGQLVDRDEQAAADQKARQVDASLRHQRADEHAGRQAEAEALRQNQEAREAELRDLLPRGVGLP